MIEYGMSIMCQLLGRNTKKVNRKSMIRKFVSKRFPIFKKPNLRLFKCENLFTLRISQKGYRTIQKIACDNGLEKASNAAKIGCYLEKKANSFLFTQLNRQKRRSIYHVYQKAISIN